MPGFPSDPDATSSSEGSDVPEEEVKEMFLDLSCYLSTMSPLELDEEESGQQVDGSWSRDGDLEGCGQLERRWVLWNEFMKEHAHLDTWLRLAEEAVSSPNFAHVTYDTAKEELRKFERLRCEAGSRLVQLDSLTQRNRTLTQLFEGTMRARLLVSTRESGQRWDNVNVKLETITTRLKLFVSEWEGFEAEREELSLWLAELDVRLSEVDHLTGNTCEKLRRLQSFQQCVCVNSGRVNDLLCRGEALIQRSEPPDAQYVESQLVELLQRCNFIYNNIARTHTRLLSMRLVFEDDWILSQVTDSGCPSESLLEEEGVIGKASLDIPDISNPLKVPPSPPHLPPPPPSPSSPSHEHLGLEWDPSVDIGRSVSHDDADSSYFSASTGLCHRDGWKRWSYLSSLGSRSDISNDNQEAELQLEEWLDRSVLSPVMTQRGGGRPDGDLWTASTPDKQDSNSGGFDGGRVRAWLGVHSPAPERRRTSCSKAVQTDKEVEQYLDGSHISAPNSQHHQDNTQQPFPAPSPSPPCDFKASLDWMKHQVRSDLQAEEEQSSCEESDRLLSKQRVTSSCRAASSMLPPALLYLILAAALAFLAYVIWVFLEPPCHRSNRMHRTFHLALRYVNGPPPT